MKQQIKIYYIIAIYILSLAHVSAQELAPDKGAYKPGEDVVISFSGGPGNTKDWVGIYKEGQTPDAVISVQYKYVGGETSGELLFDSLPAGKYEVYLFEDDGYAILAAAKFEIIQDVESPKLTSSKTTYEVGDKIVVTFSGGPGNALDWIGIYKEGQTPDAVISVQYKYVGGQTLGELYFDSLSVGKYEVHLFVDDGYDKLATAKFDVKESINNSPIVSNQSVEVDENGAVSITLIGSDKEEDTLSYTVLSQPKNGTLGGTAPVLSYSPNANYSGSDSFTFKANDGSADSNTATVSITVIENVVAELTSSKTTYEVGDKVVVTFSGGPGNALDWIGIYKEGQTPDAVISVQYKYVGGQTFGELHFDSLSVGKYEVHLFEDDGYDKLATAKFDVKESINNSPVVSNQSVDVDEDGAVSITLIGSDKEEDTLSFTVLSQPKNGTLGGTAPVLSYSPNANYSGSDSFTFKANDGSADSNTATVTINVIAGSDLGEVVYFMENFDVLELGPFVSGSESGGDGTDWTSTAPINWVQATGGGYRQTARNAATGKKVTASSEEANKGNLAKHAVDGDPTTRWCAANGATGSWLQVDLGQAQDIQNVRLIWENANGAYQYKIEGSADDKDWKLLVDQSKNKAVQQVTPHKVDAKKTRYFKITYLGANPAYWASFWEFEAHTGALPELPRKVIGDDFAVEFNGWTFLDPVSWNATAGQDRDQFKKGQGVIAVADLDEYNDKESSKLDAWLSTPEIEITRAGAGTLVLSYDSSLRQKAPQTGRVTVSYDGGEEVTLLELNACTATAYDETVELNLKNPAGAKTAVISWLHKKNIGVRWDWDGNRVDTSAGWWAIDNVKVYEERGNTAPVVAAQTATVTINVIKKKEDEPLLSLSKTEYEEGEVVEVSFSGGPGNAKDWVGIYEEGSQEMSADKFLGGRISGQLIFDPLSSGRYEVVLFENGSNQKLYTTNFNVRKKGSGWVTIVNSAISGKEYNVKLEGRDFDGDTITYRIIAKPKHGTLSGTAPNLIYRPNTDYTGSDSFSYVANDGELDSEIATVHFNIKNKNPKKWTILLYSPGDSNISYLHLAMIKELQRLGSNNNVNIVIQSDYNKYEQNMTKHAVCRDDSDYDNVVNGATRIVVGENVDKNKSMTTPVVARLPERSISENRMDDPRVFGDFLDWGMTNYPAEKYALLLHDHGGSFRGFGEDYQDGLGSLENGLLKPRAFRKEIQRSLDRAGVEKFDFINFLACLMGATEVLDAFDGLCNVFYANPSFVHGFYDSEVKFIDVLLNNPDIDNISLVEHEVEGQIRNPYFNLHEGSVHCAYDMSKYGAFKAAFYKFTADLLAEHKIDRVPINAARRTATGYYKIDYSKFPSDFIDLAHFAEILSKNVDGELKGSSVTLLDSINDMIIGKHLTSKRPKVAGLSIYHPVNGLEAGKKDYDRWDETYFAKGTGDDWYKYLQQVNSESARNGELVVLNSNGELVSRNAEFGTAESGLMSASLSQPVEIGFELKSADEAYDYFISLVSNRETDDPNQFVYLGELHRGLISGKKKHQYNWDTRLPVLSLEGGEAKAPPVGSVGVDRKELIGEMPLYLGGWWSELSDDLMISYADYQGPGEEKKTHLILTTKYLEGGAGVLNSVMLDSSLENRSPDGAGESENKVAPVGVDFIFEPGAKLWPMYYMEEPDPEKPGEWKPYFTWFKDGYIKIPENGKDGLVINWVGVEPGDYRAEVQVSDFHGNLSEELKFDIRVEGDIQGLPSLMLTLEGARVVLSWGMEDGGDEAILQWADGLGGEWVDVPSSDLGFGGAGRLYKENANDETKFYRLIKK
jgi:hypothetical protein